MHFIGSREKLLHVETTLCAVLTFDGAAHDDHALQVTRELRVQLSCQGNVGQGRQCHQGKFACDKIDFVNHSALKTT